MSLSSEKISQYTTIIDKIIANGDLATISTKQIRNGLQTAVDEDLSEYKVDIKQLILERFDKFSASEAAVPAPEPSQSNGHSVKTSKESSEPSPSASTPLSIPDEEDEDISPPPKKKRKSGAVDSDAALAAKLQAQENKRSRSTRGGGAKPARKQVTASAKKKRAKSSKKVGDEDDSDVLGSDGEKKEVVRKGGFHKEYLLSETLADLVGVTQSSRPQVVKKIWDHIKANGLQVPEDKRQIRCDEKMQRVFNVEKIHMFTMNKHLGRELYPIEE